MARHSKKDFFKTTATKNRLCVSRLRPISSFLNVYQNIAFAHPKDKNKIHEVLRLMRLENLSQQKILQLSGGQAQRVALARALTAAKNLLL
ncbi:hypothetical protein JP0098_00030 [Helicobacter pylori]|nr:hypothetical protein JP0098_00030 [Helicobacter pylori]